MTNIIRFPMTMQPSREENAARLLACFAENRRALDDVFWLKENAEVLGIFVATRQPLAEDALRPFQTFYDRIEDRMQFFPQYYRFLLSICLDLEDLGMEGNKGEALCAFVARTGLADAELSDLQRVEARRLLSRRGAACVVGAEQLDARLQAFMARSETFAMPNKKAAYELTHLVFYLSEYGRKPIELSASVLTSLEYVGVLSYLDQNVDLLAEVCTALRFAGRTPSPIWEEAVARSHHAMAPTPTATGADGYHAYLVTGWACTAAKGEAFLTPIPDGAAHFSTPGQSDGALRPLSTCLFELGHNRRAEWHKMRAHVLSYLDADGHEVLIKAEQSTDTFEAFFEGFARTRQVMRQG